MELNWPVVLLTSTVMWAVMMYRMTRRWHISIDETLEARERARCAESEARINQQKYESECKCSAVYRAAARNWAERYHDLWAQTHLGDDAIRGDDDDGRS